MKKDYFYTAIAQMIVLVSFVLSYKMIAHLFGTRSFEVFSLVKRDITFFLAVVGLGLYTALIKFISFRENKVTLFRDSFLFGILLFLLLLISTFLMEYFYLIDTNYRSIIFPAFLTASGMYFHNLVYAYFRGMGKIKIVNMFDIVNKGFAPFFALLFSNNLENFFILHGMYQLINSLLVFMYINNFIIQVKYQEFLKNMTDLISFGIRRVGADLGLNVLLLLPLITSNSENIGKIAFSITLLTVTGYFYTPLGSILLPRISKIANGVDRRDGFSLIVLSMGLTISSSIVLMFLMISFRDSILEFFVSNVEDNMLYIAHYLMFAVAPYVIYIIGKNIIDAYYDKGINSINIFMSIVIYFILYYILQFKGTIIVDILPFLFSFYYLALSTNIYILLILLKSTK